MHEFTFDMNLRATLRVDAENETQARDMIESALECADSNFGAWPNGDPITGEAGLRGAPALVSVDGGEFVRRLPRAPAEPLHVDGMDAPHPEAMAASDGQFPPFRIFSPDAQAYVPGTYPDRASAQAACDAQNLIREIAELERDSNDEFGDVILDGTTDLFDRVQAAAKRLRGAQAARAAGTPEAREFISETLPCPDHVAREIIAAPVNELNGRGDFQWWKLDSGNCALVIVPKGETYERARDLIE